MTILMPKATALWLVDHTALTFAQIGAFVGMHELEIKNIADSETVGRLQGESPLQNGLLTQAEIDRCAADPAARLQINSDYQLAVKKPKKDRRYTPMLKRANKPNAIAWLVREYPEMTDVQVGRLVGATKPTIASIRNRSHWNMANLSPASPVELGLCHLNELQKEVDVALALRRAKQSIAEQENNADSDDSVEPSESTSSETGDIDPHTLFSR